MTRPIKTDTLKGVPLDMTKDTVRDTMKDMTREIMKANM